MHSEFRIRKWYKIRGTYYAFGMKIPKLSESRYLRCDSNLQNTKNENTNFQFLLPFNKDKKRERLYMQQKQLIWLQKKLSRLSLKKNWRKFKKNSRFYALNGRTNFFWLKNDFFER